MDDVRAGIQYLFQTKNALTFAASGTDHGTIIYNLFVDMPKQ